MSFGFFAAGGGWKSKNTAYKCINLTLRAVEDNPGILQHSLTFD